MFEASKEITSYENCKCILCSHFVKRFLANFEGKKNYTFSMFN